MDRRAFLQWFSVASTGAALAGLGYHVLCSHWQVGGKAVHPGAQVQVRLHDDTPRGCHVRLVVEWQGQRFAAGAVAAVPGAVVTLETPYPHADLLPGTYRVDLELLGRRGTVLETAQVGDYTLRRYYFSA